MPQSASWQERAQTQTLWQQWFRCVSALTHFPDDGETKQAALDRRVAELLVAREKLLGLPSPFSFRTWSVPFAGALDQSLSECVWHDPLAVSLAQASKSKGLPRIAGLLQAVEQVFSETPDAIAISWETQDAKAEVGYQPLLWLALLANIHPLWRGEDGEYPPGLLNTPEPDYKSALDVSRVLETPRFWVHQANQTAAEVVAMSWNHLNDRSTDVVFGVMHEMGVVFDLDLAEALEESGALMPKVCNRLVARAKHHHWDAQWPAASKGKAPRF